jgi:hypothetical protein
MTATSAVLVISLVVPGLEAVLRMMGPGTRGIGHA